MRSKGAQTKGRVVEAISKLYLREAESLALYQVNLLRLMALKKSAARILHSVRIMYIMTNLCGPTARPDRP
jgi:hypothetical protein